MELSLKVIDGEIYLVGAVQSPESLPIAARREGELTLHEAYVRAAHVLQEASNQCRSYADEALAEWTLDRS